MGRPKGRRSPDYEQKRAQLARKVFECILEDGGTSLNAMAEHTGVSRPTLRHYFGDREGAVRAALMTAAQLGQVHVDSLGQLPLTTARETLLDALTRIAEAWNRFQVGRFHEVGFKVGLEDPETGRTYVEHLLEPMLGALEVLIGRLVAAQLLEPVEPRAAALQLLAPATVGLLHQHGLGGHAVRPLDVDTLNAQVVATFCRAHARP